MSHDQQTVARLTISYYMKLLSISTFTTRIRSITAGVMSAAASPPMVA